jgi:beta-glucanase (GH16 family)
MYMNISKGIFLLGVVSGLICGSCDKADGEDPIVVPSNLQITVDVSTDGSGKVDVTATADNAAYFNIYFGEVFPDPPMQTTDGTESHTYEASGTYTIKVSAHSSTTDLISATKVIEVDVAFQDVGYVSPETREGFDLVWEEQFTGDVLNSSVWTHEIGNGSSGWGNNELEYYREQNTNVSDGYLTITAKKESFSGYNYTSSRIKTQDKKTFVYGRIDIRAKLPKGQGIWPALWMLGNNISSVGWPSCGEIDIMEMIGGEDREKTVHGTLHWSSPSGSHAQAGGSKVIASGTYADEFHVYSIEWDEQFVKWYIDDVFFAQIDITQPDHSDLSEFHEPQFFIINLAVGGNWPGSPNNTTIFPQKLIVDYIRVFQEP